ncbi:hypothetical protein [Sorangium sp. So ce1000]|jgi:hypothetical protein|uniref:hypothetical protein n=1 Tax=Sorangium sp. So ce1000 TaxID=3133325 RepID=UPI003F5EE1A2
MPDEVLDEVSPDALDDPPPEALDEALPDVLDGPPPAPPAFSGGVSSLDDPQAAVTHRRSAA